MKKCVVPRHFCRCVRWLSVQGKWLLSCVRLVQPLGGRAVKGTLFPPSADRQRAPSAHRRGRERETLCAYMWTEGREMAIDPNEGDGNEKGPSMCTSGSQNISAFTELTIQVGTHNWQLCCMCLYLDVNADLKWREGCDCTPSLLCSASTRKVWFCVFVRQQWQLGLHSR